MSVALVPAFSAPVRDVARNIVLPVAGVSLVLFVPIAWTTTAFLILGHTHFAMAFLYHWKSGRATKPYLLLVALLAIASIAYFALGGTVIPIFLVAVALFGVHFAFDELFLHGEAITPPRALTAFLFSVMFFALVLAETLPGFEGLPVVVTGVVFLSWIVARLLTAAEPFLAGERYLALLGVLLFTGTLLFDVAIPLLVIIVLLHSVNWAIDYGRKLADCGDVNKLRRYWTETAWVLAAVAALYLVYLAANFSVLQYAFVPTYYYAWAVAHIALSFQLSRFALS